MKRYPRRYYKDGINFKFTVKGLKGYWFNIRFAGNPLIVIEQLYKDAGGEDFARVYETAKTAPQKLTKEEREALKFAVVTTEVFLNALSHASRPPLVMYTNYGEGEEQKED